MLTTRIFADADAIGLHEASTFETDYVSLVNNQTYGPPALIAPAPHGRDGKRAEPGQVVLFVNTNLVPVFSIVEEEEE